MAISRRLGDLSPVLEGTGQLVLASPGAPAESEDLTAGHEPVLTALDDIVDRRGELSDATPVA